MTAPCRDAPTSISSRRSTAFRCSAGASPGSSTPPAPPCRCSERSTRNIDADTTPALTSDRRRLPPRTRAGRTARRGPATSSGRSAVAGRRLCPVVPHRHERRALLLRRRRRRPDPARRRCVPQAVGGRQRKRLRGAAGQSSARRGTDPGSRPTTVCGRPRSSLSTGASTRCESTVCFWSTSAATCRPACRSGRRPTSRPTPTTTGRTRLSSRSHAHTGWTYDYLHARHGWQGTGRRRRTHPQRRQLRLRSG